ncbi:sulfotransferase 1 family member D1-like isoform X1 [Chironomus tepperi]|uniref:sulfotransferase 1 family member D1-like isoform X1 n=1 Tax=Chironomus tepperi TaxID=113505 RepID=UPI00391FC225
MFTVDKIEGDLIKKVDTVITNDYVKVCARDKFCILPQKFVDKFLTRIKQMEVYEDDIWIVTFIKCGTTWTQEMLWMLNNNLDFETALSKTLAERFPFIEIGALMAPVDVDSFEMCSKTPRPRHIKTHLPMFLLPDKIWSVKPKIVYVARNPKDVAVSYFHHYRHMHGYRGTMETFLNAFASNQILYAPYNDHVVDFWKIRNEPNVLFLFYEDMKRNLKLEVLKAMKFLNKNYSEDEINKLCQHLSFESMKNNPSVNFEDLLSMLRELHKTNGLPHIDAFNFIRKGQIGSHKEELTENESKMLNAFVDDPQLKECGFEYKF